MSFLLEPPVMRRANAPVEEQMQSAFSYMYKMAEALNYALNNIDFENLSESVQGFCIPLCRKAYISCGRTDAAQRLS